MDRILTWAWLSVNIKEHIRYQIFRSRLDDRWYVRVVRYGQSEVLSKNGFATWRRACARAQSHYALVNRGLR